MTAVAEFDPVLVTGASGFVGACAVHALVERGHTVHVLLRETSSAWRLAPVWSRLHVHRADLTDAAVTHQAVAAARPKVILNLATYGAYEKQAEATTILRTNVLGASHLLEAAAAGRVGLFIHTGSSSEYGFQSHPMRETDLPEPNSFYAVAKLAQTHLCQLAARRTGLRAVVLRLFSVYGPWEEPSRLVPTVLRRARAGLPLEMVAPDVARDFVYVADVLEVLLDFPRLAALPGEVINLGSGKQTSLCELVAVVKELLGSSSPVRWGAMAPRQWDTDRWCADTAKAHRLLGWVPRHTLHQGLAATADWLAGRGDAYGPDQLHAA
jgi:nucleoside-diphosphate-sugar epimerase